MLGSERLCSAVSPMSATPTSDTEKNPRNGGILRLRLAYGRRSNKTPAQAFTPPTDEKKMGTIWILVYYTVYGSRRGRCRNFLVLNWRGGGGGLHLQIWDLNRAQRRLDSYHVIFSTNEIALF